MAICGSGTSRGLYRYDLDTGRFDTCAAPGDRLVIVDLIESDGRIFFAASDGKLWVVDRRDDQRHPRALSEGPFAPLTGVTAMARGKGSAIWVAAQGRLFELDVNANDSGGRLTEALRDLGTVPVLATIRRATCGSDDWMQS